MLPVGDRVHDNVPARLAVGKIGHFAGAVVVLDANFGVVPAHGGHAAAVPVGVIKLHLDAQARFDVGAARLDFEFAHEVVSHERVGGWHGIGGGFAVVVVVAVLLIVVVVVTAVCDARFALGFFLLGAKFLRGWWLR